jgi:protein TonB
VTVEQDERQEDRASEVEAPASEVQDAPVPEFGCRPSAAEHWIGRLTVAAGAAVSLALHAGAAFLLLMWGEAQPGAVSAPTEAISIEIVLTDVIEAALEEPRQEAAAMQAAVDSEKGDVEDAAAGADRDTPTPTEAEPDTRRDDQALHAPESEQSDVPPDAVSAPAPAEAERAPIQAEAPPPAVPEQSTPPKEATAEVAPPEPKPPAKERRKRKTAEPAVRKGQKEAKRKGGEQSRAARGAQSSGGRTSASTGSMLNYAAVVRARVASRKPAGIGGAGRVVVGFKITPGGGLALARVVSSSGNAALDRLALSAVHRAAPFPTPPAGASSRQLSYSMSFTFN